MWFFRPINFSLIPLHRLRQYWRGEDRLTHTHSPSGGELSIGRASQLQTVANSYLGVLDAAEAQALPALRDALLQIIAKELSKSSDYVAEYLSGEFLFDFRLNAGPRTTRAELAIETLQGILSSYVRGNW